MEKQLEKINKAKSKKLALGHELKQLQSLQGYQCLQGYQYLQGYSSLQGYQDLQAYKGSIKAQTCES